MRAWLERLLRGLHRLEDAALALLLLGMIGVAVMQIALRNFFHVGFLWADSFLRVLVLWIGLAGAMAASRQHRHINIDIVSRFLPLPLRYAAKVFTALFTAAVCFIVAWYALDFVRMEYQSPNPAFANVPTWVCESIIPFAFTVIGLRYLLLALLPLSPDAISDLSSGGAPPGMMAEEVALPANGGDISTNDGNPAANNGNLSANGGDNSSDNSGGRS